MSGSGGKSKKKGGGGGNSSAKKKAAKKKAAAASAASATRDANVAALEALRRLSAVLSDLDETGGGGGSGSAAASNLKLSHWRTPTEDVGAAYKMLDDGSELVRATSTKYTLVGKVDHDEGSKMADDLRKGCELLASGAVVIFDPSVGCSRSSRRFARSASRAAVATVSSLVQSFVDGTALNENVGARLTGAVWSACDGVKKTPRGNRASGRREMLTWAGECNETMEEFEELLELGPAATAATLDVVEEEGSEGNDAAGGGAALGRQESAGWNDFCGDAGTGERYSDAEAPPVRACLALVKCSRGTVKTALEACEFVGTALEREAAAASDASSDASSAEDEEGRAEFRAERERKLRWIGALVELARDVGEGVTELGTLLYPPLDVAPGGEEGECELSQRIYLQRDAIVAAHDHILGEAKEEGVDAATEKGAAVSKEIAATAGKIRAAAGTRATEAREALEEARRQGQQR